MPNVSFLLTQPTADKPTPIFAFFSFDGRRVKVYSGLSIHPKYWIKADQRAQTRGFAGGGTINAALDVMAKRLQDCYNECRAQGQLPTAEMLRDAVEPEAVPEASPERPLPLVDFEAFIERQARTKQPATVKSLRTTCNHLRTFWEQSASPRWVGMPLEYADLTTALYDRFTQYLVDVAGLTDNSISKQSSLLKQFLTYAVGEGRVVAAEYKRWTWSRREPEVVALTRGELRALEEVALPAGHYLANARALFLLSCYTGLRFSDVEALKPAQDKGDRLRLTTKKTRDTLTVPVSPKARQLLDALWAGAIHPITNQKLNSFLKDLAQRASIDAPTEYTSYRAGKRLTETFPKWKLISSHTGRRTFVTLALEAGVPQEVIQRCTGHRSGRSFARYVHVTEDRQVTAFNRVWAEGEAKPAAAME